MNGYTRFGAMIATSTLVMFGLMYLNTYQMDHVFFSETRAYMALVMGATMAVRHAVLHVKHVQGPTRQPRHHRWKRDRVRGGALARSEPGDRGRRLVYEGDDPAPLDCHSHE